MHFFANNFPESFKYENKINCENGKDVDCSFVYENVQFNIEVKCADFTRSHDISSEIGISIDFFGRHEDRLALLSDLKRAVDRQIFLQQHMDNKLKSYLEDAHRKFYPSAREDHLNVLVVGCDSCLDMTKWIGYLLGNQGLFTEKTFVNPESYRLVDYVVLSNVYHRHYNSMGKDKIFDHWLLDKAFNLCFINPFRQLAKESAIGRFTSIVPNFSKEFFDFKPASDDYGNDHSCLNLSFLVDEIERKNNFLYFQSLVN